MFGPDSSSSLTLEELQNLILAIDYFKDLNVDTDKNIKGDSLSETKENFQEVLE